MWYEGYFILLKVIIYNEDIIFMNIYVIINIVINFINKKLYRKYKNIIIEGYFNIWFLK